MRNSATGNKTGGMSEPARARKSAAMRKFSAARNSFGMSEQWMSVTVVVAIGESPAVGDVPVMVVYQVVVVPVDNPRIIFRHVNDFRVCWFNHDRLSLGRDGFVPRALQVPGLLRSLTHHLNCVK